MNSLSEIKNIEEIKNILQSYKDVIVLYFSASWSPECDQMLIILKENIKNPDYNNMTFVKLEAENFEKYVRDYNVEIVPTIIFIKDVKLVDRIDGINPLLLQQKLNQWALTFPSKSFIDMHISENPLALKSLNEKLNQLINNSPNMLFMKGSPSNPQCGFSKQIIHILEKNDIKYSYFDILQDSVVREGLKAFSDWPTYPQLYNKGELIGGLDIVKELDQMGDLKTTLDVPSQIDNQLGEKANDAIVSKDINIRLKQLINQANVMVFMKGHPSNPMCKFSKVLIPMLNATKIPYQSFDILEDEEVRQGLKEYSDWPTYPQIYVKGQFIGGLDIAKELEASGKLISTLTGQE